MAIFLVLFLFLGIIIAILSPGLIIISLYCCIFYSLLFFPLYYLFIKKGRRLQLSVFILVFCTILDYYKWKLIDLVPPLIMFPIGLIITLPILLVTIVFSLRHLIDRYKSTGKKALGPLAVNFLTILVILFAPLPSIWLKNYYSSYKEERGKVVQEVHNGKLEPNVSHNSSLIKLPDNYPVLSTNGNEIIVYENYGTKGESYILFFTFRGILDNYSGLVYIPPNGSIEEFEKMRGTKFIQIKELDPNWYYIANV